MPLTPGTRLGPYEVVAAIGSGGMGEVYRARDARLNRDVAIKVLPQSFANDPERRARLEREAQIMATLSHPNVVTAFDIGIHDGHIYIVTELLEGETLRERLDSGALPLRKAIDCAVQIARGLAAAHDKHLIHRDLKPENVFLLNDGRVKILDFGVARYEAASDKTETAAAVTDSGTILGTVGYMAPEQVRGQAVDPRADLFAFGAVTYEMLIGRRAFQRDTSAETMTAILREDPPEITQLRADLPPALERIVRHCLEKNPAERFQSAHDVAFALEALSVAGPATTAHAIPAGLPAPQSSRLVAWGGVLILAAALLAWSVWGMTRSRSGDAGSAERLPIALGSSTQVTSEDGLEIDPDLSPDGRLLAYAAGKPTQMRTYIRPVAGGRTIALSEGNAKFEYQPRWSPDGDQILYVTDAGAFVASALGGASERLAPGAVHAAAWSPDGKQVAIARDGALSIIQRDGTGERAVASGAAQIYSCTWSRNDLIACASGNRQGVIPGPIFGNIAPSAIVLVPAAGGSLTEVTDRQSLNQGPVWSADGRYLYFISNRHGPRDIYVVEVEPTGRLRGEPRRISTGLGVQSIAFSRDGQHLAYAVYSARANIWSLPSPATGTADASAARPVTSGNQIVEAMRVSRDRQWILYDSTTQLNSDIFRKPLSGGAEVRVTTDPNDDFSPDVGPNGELAFHSWRSGARQLFVKPLEGGVPLQVPTQGRQPSYPIWSPDGSALAFVDQALEDGMTRGLFVIRRGPAGNWGEQASLRRGVNVHGFWAPDGRSLVFPNAGAIERIPVEPGSPRVIYSPSPPSGDPIAESVASEDGQTLYFKSHDAEGRASIWTLPIAGGKPRQVVRFSDLSRMSIRPDFAVGAGQIFFTLEDRQADIMVAEIKR